MVHGADRSRKLLLGRRLTMVVAGIASILALAYMGAGVWFSRNQLEKDFEQTANLVAASLASSMIDEILTNNLSQLPVLLERAMATNKNAIYGFVTDSKGTPLSNTFDKGVPGDLQVLARVHAVKGGGRAAWTLRTEKGDVYHLVLPLSGRPGGFLHLGFSWKPVDRKLARLVRQLLGAMGLALMLSAIMGMLVYRRMAQPISELTDAAAEFGEGNLSRRVPVRGRGGADDEVTLLAMAFNRMADQLQEKIQDLANSRSELADEKTLIQAILDGMLHGVVFYEPDGGIGYWNQAAKNHWGWTDGKAPYSFREFHRGRQDVVEVFESVANDNEGSAYLRVKTGDRVLNVVFSAIKRQGGQSLGIVEISSDVTEQLASERALAHAEKLGVVGQLAAGIAHEINSPLDGAIEASRIIEEGETRAEEARRYAAAQRQALERIATIVRRLLTYSRRDAPGLEPVAVSQVIHEAVELVRYRLHKRGIRIETPGGEVESVVEGQTLELSQVMVNLLSNAIDESPPGSVIRIEVQEQGGEVTLSVADQGGGIPEDATDRIFTPFFTTKGVGKGTGLGLAVSRNIVEQYGGAIYFENLDPPWGARFSVRLPLMNRRKER